jgi:hypothetical protein
MEKLLERSHIAAGQKTQISFLIGVPTIVYFLISVLSMDSVDKERSRETLRRIDNLPRFGRKKAIHLVPQKAIPNISIPGPQAANPMQVLLQ